MDEIPKFHQNYKTPFPWYLPSASTSLIMSCSSASVGFCPRDLMTVPNSLVVMVPSPSLSNSEKASLNSAICSSVSWSAWEQQYANQTVATTHQWMDILHDNLIESCDADCGCDCGYEFTAHLSVSILKKVKSTLLNSRLETDYSVWTLVWLRTRFRSYPIGNNL